MPNQWNKRDLLRLTRDCELGKQGEQLHVVKVVGPYMTVRKPSGISMHTGRDYEFAIKIGEGAIDAATSSFAQIGDALIACEDKLRDAEHRMRAIPTARLPAIRLAEVCDRLEEITEEFSGADHVGNR